MCMYTVIGPKASLYPEFLCSLLLVWVHFQQTLLLLIWMYFFLCLWQPACLEAILNFIFVTLCTKSLMTLFIHVTDKLFVDQLYFRPSLYGRPRFYKKIHSDWITKSFHQRLVFTYYFLVHRKYLVYFLFIAGRLSLLALPLLFLGNLSCWYMDLYFCFLPAGRVLPLILLEFFCCCDCLLTGWLTWQLARLCREVGCWLI